jgi:hypothetical protein
MPEVNLLAVVVAAAAAFLQSSAWYAAFGALLAPAEGPPPTAQHPPLSKVGVELLRSLVLAAVLAGLASRSDVSGWSGGAVLGLALWVGFPLVLWTGALTWEGTPLRVAAVHAGDWLVKLVLITVLVSVWR